MDEVIVYEDELNEMLSMDLIDEFYILCFGGNKNKGFQFVEHLYNRFPKEDTDCIPSIILNSEVDNKSFQKLMIKYLEIIKKKQSLYT